MRSHLHVSFACDVNDAVAALAAEHLAALGDGCPEAARFLSDLAGRRGSNPGIGGGLCLWGIVATHLDVAQFLGDLSPFFSGLLDVDRDAGSPHAFEHVLVFHEAEAAGAAEAYEVSWSPAGLAVARHPMPFAWVQM